MFSISKTATLALVLALSACSQTAENTRAIAEAPKVGLALEDFSSQRMQADVEFLADDYLKGRDAGSEGYEIAARYVAANYKRLGLTPMGDEGSYFQHIAWARTGVQEGSGTMALTRGGQTVTMDWGTDYVTSGSSRSPAFDVSGSMVFAGYGIDAPALGYSDFEGIDVAGKIAVVFNRAPASFDTVPKLHYQRTDTKARILRDKGAIGMLIVSTAGYEKAVAFERVAGSWKSPGFDWKNPESGESPEPIPAMARIPAATADKLFEGSMMSFQEVLAAETAGDGSMKSFDLSGSLQLASASEEVESLNSPNVVALIEGSDPKLKDEYIVLSAHLDHVGVSENLPGDDKIRNGAMDNATGTSVLMEVARAYAENGLKPRRSIILLSVTAEEKGLLGAEYFAEFPTVPFEKIIANVNLDMPVLLYNFADVIGFGADHSSMGDITDRAAARAGIFRGEDPLPNEGLFVRSDHYRFVERGVPSIFLMTGFAETEDGENGGEKFMNFLQTHYHRPSDDTNLPINYKAAQKFAFVNYLILDEIANADERPKWNEGSIFKDIR